MVRFYENPEMEINKFDIEDTITASGTPPTQKPGGGEWEGEREPMALFE